MAQSRRGRSRRCPLPARCGDPGKGRLGPQQAKLCPQGLSTGPTAVTVGEARGAEWWQWRARAETAGHPSRAGVLFLHLGTCPRPSRQDWIPRPPLAVPPVWERVTCQGRGEDGRGSDNQRCPRKAAHGRMAPSPAPQVTRWQQTGRCGCAHAREALSGKARTLPENSGSGHRADCPPPPGRSLGQGSPTLEPSGQAAVPPAGRRLPPRPTAQGKPGQVTAAPGGH